MWQSLLDDDHWTRPRDHNTHRSSPNNAFLSPLHAEAAPFPTQSSYDLIFSGNLEVDSELEESLEGLGVNDFGAEPFGEILDITPGRINSAGIDTSQPQHVPGTTNLMLSPGFSGNHFCELS